MTAIQKISLPRGLKVRPLAGLGREMLVRMGPIGAARKLFGISFAEESHAVEHLQGFGLRKCLSGEGHYIDLSAMEEAFSERVPNELVLRKGEERTRQNALIAAIGRLGSIDVFKCLDIPERETQIGLIVECLQPERPNESADQMAALAKKIYPDSYDLQEQLVVDVARELYPDNISQKAVFMVETDKLLKPEETP